MKTRCCITRHTQKHDITEVCRIFATAECIAFHIRNALGTVAGANFKGHNYYVTLNIAHNKLLHVKALVAEILQTSVYAIHVHKMYVHVHVHVHVTVHENMMLHYKTYMKTYVLVHKNMIFYALWPVAKNSGNYPHINSHKLRESSERS